MQCWSGIQPAWPQNINGNRGNGTHVSLTGETLGRLVVQLNKLGKTAWISYLDLLMAFLSDEM